MRLSIFTKFTPLRLLSVANTRFASIIVMLKRLKLIKKGLQAMFISEEWSSYRLDETEKANYVKEYILNDDWWDKVAYILSFTGLIYKMIRVCDTDKPCLHLVYYSDAWLMEDSTRCAPHRNEELSQERMKYFRRLFPNDDEYGRDLDEYAMFSMKSGPFGLICRCELSFRCKHDE
ncbi:unnamed protein product [Lactuca saligna]|uniref:Uncharacterized protein n=1 Tax=Lactuca saligna TaxID=75948 RepID=A0AA35UTZ6_LACSI|nr:unnamed protein product [Lactuca saligna]